MCKIRWIILAGLAVIILSGTGVAQEKPVISLGFSEKCNNFLRHYCLAGSHEIAVNQALLDMKVQGTPITVKLIKQVARRTPARMKTFPSAQAQ